MKFVLASAHTYWWPVKVVMPNPNPKMAGKVITQEMKMQFCAMPLDEAQQLADEIATLEPKERIQREHDHMMAVSRDWADVTDGNGGDIQFSEENLRAAMQSSFFRLAIYRAFNESLRGEAARKGN